MFVWLFPSYSIYGKKTATAATATTHMIRTTQALFVWKFSSGSRLLMEFFCVYVVYTTLYMCVPGLFERRICIFRANERNGRWDSEEMRSNIKIVSASGISRGMWILWLYRNRYILASMQWWIYVLIAPVTTCKWVEWLFFWLLISFSPFHSLHTRHNVNFHPYMPHSTKYILLNWALLQLCQRVCVQMGKCIRIA